MYAQVFGIRLNDRQIAASMDMSSNAVVGGWVRGWSTTKWHMPCRTRKGSTVGSRRQVAYASRASS
jgi:hypothetical protein